MSPTPIGVVRPRWRGTARISGRGVSAALLVALAGAPCGCDKVKAFVVGEPSRVEKAEALRLQAVQAEQAGDDKAAIADYEGVRALIVNDAASAFALGKLYEKAGNDAQAILSLKEAASVDDNPEIRKRLAALYLRHGEAAEAGKVLTDLATSDAPDLDSQIKLARTQLVGGKADEALARADELLGPNPTNVDLLDLKAEALLAKGDTDGAAQTLDAAVAANPKSVEVRLVRARFLAEQGMPEKALGELDRIDPEASGRPEVVFAKSAQLMQLKRTDEASKLVGDYVESHPNDVDGQAVLASIRLAAGDYDGARAAAEGVLARTPHNVRALFVRARCLEQTDPPDRVIAAYREVLDQDEGNADTLHRVWRIYEKGGQLTDTIAALENLDSRGLAAADERFELARLYADTGLNPARGLKLVAALAKETPKPAGLDEVRRKLSGGSHRGVQMIQGKHHLQ